MYNSKIEKFNQKPTLFIDGKATPAMAYTTYFPERSAHRDFIKAGYRIFFVNVSFTISPINSITGFTPFHIGVFEDKSNPDYSEFENSVYDILKSCPDAVIFPRIYISMPKWWIEQNPDETVPTENGGNREALFSKKFRTDGGKLLAELVRHIMHSDYQGCIAGWQICGGLTQEWFHHDMKGSLPAAKNELIFEDFEYKDNYFNTNEKARQYSLFSNYSVAETVDFFANVIKKETDYKQIVGTFYGYAYQSNGSTLFGTHALRCLLDSKNIDFFSSPNAYAQNRAFGIDWADMIPVDSIKHHKKLNFIECDIRTHLTSAVQDARPGEYPDNIYKTQSGASVWSGPPTSELSCAALRKCFAHQLTKASAIWWFDMWGGWYKDRELMSELGEMKKIYQNDLLSQNSGPSPEVVLFADERAYANMMNKSPQHKGIVETRTAMGKTGVPFDCCMVEDAKEILHKYKAAVFVMPMPSEAGAYAMELCKERGVPYLAATNERFILTVDELCKFYEKSGVHMYTEKNDVVYVGNGYVALHSNCGGRKTIKLPKSFTVKVVFGADIESKYTDTVEFDLKENGTAIFEVLE